MTCARAAKGGGVIRAVTARASRALAAAALLLGLPVAGVVAAAPAAAAAAAAPARTTASSAPRGTAGGASAALEGLRTYGQAVVHDGGKDRTTGAGLFEMAVDGGGTLQTYGVDIDNSTQEQARYEEAPWSASSLHGNRDAGKIRWILQHSYPQRNDLATLARSAGAGQLTPRTAAAGTQIAIWRYSDGADVDAVDPAAEKLAAYLRGAARNLTEPRASLSLDPVGPQSGHHGLLGPVNVRAEEPGVAVAPDRKSTARGIRVVREDGRPADSARDGSRLFLDVPEKDKRGTALLTAQAAAKVAVGRVLTGIGEQPVSQTQVVAGSSRSMVSATTAVGWANGAALPSVRVEKDCGKEGVDVTVANGGHVPFRFSLDRKRQVVAASATSTRTVPVEEDQPYRIRVSGAEGFGRTVTGVLNCATTRAMSSRQETGATSRSQVARGARSTVSEGARRGGSLAETGSGDDTWLILGLATGLLVIGVTAVLAVRRREPGA